MIPRENWCGLWHRWSAPLENESEVGDQMLAPPLFSVVRKKPMRRVVSEEKLWESPLRDFVSGEREDLSGKASLDRNYCATRCHIQMWISLVARRVPPQCSVVENQESPVLQDSC